MYPPPNMRTCIQTCAHMCMHACVHVGGCVCACMRVHTCTHVCMCARVLQACEDTHRVHIRLGPHRTRIGDSHIPAAAPVCRTQRRRRRRRWQGRQRVVGCILACMFACRVHIACVLQVTVHGYLVYVCCTNAGYILEYDHRRLLDAYTFSREARRGEARRGGCYCCCCYCCCYCRCFCCSGGDSGSGGPRSLLE